MAKKSALNRKPSTHTARRRNAGVKDRRKAAFRALDAFVQQSATSRNTTEVRLEATDTIPFKFGGKQEYVTTSDINAYSQYLMVNQIALQVTKRNKSYLFRLAEGGLSLLKKSEFSSSAAIRPNLKTVSTVIQTRQKPVGIDPGVRAINLNVARVVAGFKAADPEKLIATYRNAERILKEPNRGESHVKAQEVLQALKVEFDKRSATAPANERFKWPTTEAPSGSSASSLELPKTLTEGMLAHMDYRVGRTHGAHPSVRQSILRRIFEDSLPAAFDSAYMDEWGPNGSASRLKKMAESIASFTKMAKRRDADRLQDAIYDWEHDLQFLHDRYYVGKFSFGWPTTRP